MVPAFAQKRDESRDAASRSDRSTYFFPYVHGRELRQRPGRIALGAVAAASRALAALSVQLCGDAVATALAASILLGAAATSPREETARPRLLRALSRVRTASGELALLQWSPEDDDALIAARSVDVSESNVLRDVPSSDELAAADELRALSLIHI